MKPIAKEEFERLLRAFSEVDSGTPKAPRVSVCLITYNHQKFIAEAIESVLAQKPDFEFEVVIGEDCSTDGTRDIVLEYQRKYPALIRLILAQEGGGKYTGNGRLNFIRTLQACRGEYIACLEGDDYWISPRKLQIQADYLDAHPDHSECCHGARTISDSKALNLLAPPIPGRLFGVEDLLRNGNFIPTCSILFRREVVSHLPESFYYVPVGDWPLNILNACRGPIAWIDEVMGAYRIHSGGTWSSLDPVQVWERNLKIFEFFNACLPVKYRPLVDAKIAEAVFRLAIAALKNGDRENARRYLGQCWAARYFRYANKLDLLKVSLKTYSPDAFRMASQCKHWLGHAKVPPSP